METAIVICTRLESSRIPNKAIKKINGVPVIEHLVRRLLKSKLPIVIATPFGQRATFQEILKEYDVKYFEGYCLDPLARLSAVALSYECYKIKNVIRVTHDKIFIDHLDLIKALELFEGGSYDYLYGSEFIPGCGFEIFSSGSLKYAAHLYNKVEHVSYAIRCVVDENKTINYKPRTTARDVRLLIDFPEDIEVMTTLLSVLGNDCSLNKVLTFMSANSWLSGINRMPIVTIYTCAYNADSWINAAMDSVLAQTIMGQCEYILIDDHSTDDTAYFMSRNAAMYKNVKYIRNGENMGLASSSNVALKEARGRYIVRLDADDYFTNKYSLTDLIFDIETKGVDVVYPDNNIQKAKENHHVGGAIFNTSAINHLKFTDNLRNYEGLDLFTRAKSQLSIGYLDKEIYFYRQHKKSMSRTNLIERAATKAQIEAGSYL